MSSFWQSWFVPNENSRNGKGGGRKNQQRRNCNKSPPPRRSPSPDNTTQTIEELMQNLDLGADSVFNVLLLGETGVGKSTFINSLANYMEFHENFEHAESESLQVLIPTKITEYDKDHKLHLLQIGKSHKNENVEEVGASSTQKIRTYKFEFKTGGALRIIDTPGMGDTRGLKQDEENCEFILTYISQLKELHAICYLFRPQVARATVAFRYCMTQILSRLDKSACDNIIFVFTDAKDFNPGETYTILKDLRDKIKKSPPHVSIPIENNIFCFDNEPFKYLAGLQRGVEYSAEKRRTMKNTWRKSTDECYKLINFIIKLEPHNVRNTAAINECRRVIFQLSQPMAQITQHIDDHLYMLERHEAQMDIDNSTLEELKGKLYMPIVDLEVKELERPVTVCTETKCSEVYMVGDRTKWHYKSRCHNPCFLQNVPRDIIGDPALMNCTAMGGNQNCNECGCHYKVHMHVYYESETVHKQEVNENVQENMKTKEGVLIEARKVIEDIKKKKNQLQGELDTIISFNAKFAHFVQNNAITPINDSYEDYIKHLIKAEERLGANSDRRKLDGLRQLLREHAQVKETLQKADEYQKKMGKDFRSVTPNDINSCIQQLFKLKLNGPTIKAMYEAQNKSRQEEYLDSEYVHQNKFDGKKQQGKKGKKGKKNNNKSHHGGPSTSYAQATRGYPEVPQHDIESDSESDDDEEQDDQRMSRDRRGPPQDRYPGDFRGFPPQAGYYPDYSRGYPERVYPSARERDDYFYNVDMFYRTQPPNMYYRDTAEMQRREEYFRRCGRFPESGMNPGQNDAPGDGSKNGSTTDKQKPDNGAPPAYDAPPAYGGPPPYGDFPERYRDVPEMWGPYRNYPRREGGQFEAADNANPDMDRTLPRADPDIRSREPFERSGYGPYGDFAQPADDYYRRGDPRGYPYYGPPLPPFAFHHSGLVRGGYGEYYPPPSMGYNRADPRLGGFTNYAAAEGMANRYPDDPRLPRYSDVPSRYPYPPRDSYGARPQPQPATEQPVKNNEPPKQAKQPATNANQFNKTPNRVQETVVGANGANQHPAEKTEKISANQLAMKTEDMFARVNALKENVLATIAVGRAADANVQGVDKIVAPESTPPIEAKDDDNKSTQKSDEPCLSLPWYYYDDRLDEACSAPLAPLGH